MKKLFSILLCAVLIFCSAAICFADGEPAGDENYKTKADGHKYYIMVNRQMNTVTVYTAGDDGFYSVPYKAMICSTAREGHTTPSGTFSSSPLARWCYMVDGSYGQYATRIKGAILFHSVCYHKQDQSTLMTEEYNMLGGVASLGCVRLQTADAKWIYENCSSGTKVTIYDSPDPGPLGKPEKSVAEITSELDNGWDPTDPSENNPWKAVFDEQMKTLPFDDLSYGAWYTDHIRYAYENGLMMGTGGTHFTPNGKLTKAMVLQIMYAMTDGARDAFPKSADDENWFDAPLAWAVDAKIAGDVLFNARTANDVISRQELALLLYRYENAKNGGNSGNGSSGGSIGSGSSADGSASSGAADAKDPLAAFSDASSVKTYAKDAVSWMVSEGLLAGKTANTLAPEDPLTRAQFAAILERYLCRD